MKTTFCVCVLLATLLTAAAHAQTALPPIESVTFDDTGRFLVNGKPFFPILLYDAPTDDATLATLREYGFNTLWVKDAKDAAALREKGFYGACHVHAKVEDASGMLLAIGSDSPAMYVKENLVGKTVEENKKSTELSGRPVMNAIGYWENEPEGVKAGTLYPKEKYADLAAAIDVPAPYLYPVPYQPISTVGDAVAVAKKAGGAGKPVLPIIQIFAWTAEDRYPTPAELRAMAFASLIEGATGIGYYSYGSVTGHKGKTIADVQPELWKSVKGLNSELADVMRHMRSTRPDEKISVDPVEGVRWKAFDGFVVIVNQTDQPRKLKLNFGRPVKTNADEVNWVLQVDAPTGQGTLELKPFQADVLNFVDR